ATGGRGAPRGAAARRGTLRSTRPELRRRPRPPATAPARPSAWQRARGPAGSSGLLELHLDQRIDHLAPEAAIAGGVHAVAVADDHGRAGREVDGDISPEPAEMVPREAVPVDVVHARDVGGDPEADLLRAGPRGKPIRGVHQPEALGEDLLDEV